MGLFKYEGKYVRLTTKDGLTVEGIAYSYSSGYGEHEFNVPEESLSVGEYQIFKSEIKKIKVFKEIPEGYVPDDDE